MLKNAPNQADYTSIFQLCLLLKMRLSVDLEGRFTGYECIYILSSFTQVEFDQQFEAHGGMEWDQSNFCNGLHRRG